jgi:hypothetical protein
MVFFQIPINKNLVMFLQDNVTIFVIIINKNEELKSVGKLNLIFNWYSYFVFAITGSTSALLSKPVCRDYRRDFGYYTSPAVNHFPLYQVLWS